MLQQRPHIFTPEESAFAAEHFTLVHAFLAENDLPEDDYYDAALNGYLKAVQEHFASPVVDDFQRSASVLMSAACSAYDEKRSRAPVVLSLSECYNGAHELEEIVADAKNTIDEAISAICFEETMQSFNATQQRIVRLLMKGYAETDIADMLEMSLSALFEEIGAIRRKAAKTLFAAA